MPKKPSETFWEQIKLSKEARPDADPNSIIQGVLLGLLDQQAEELSSLKQWKEGVMIALRILYKNTQFDAFSTRAKDYEWLKQFLSSQIVKP